MYPGKFCKSAPKNTHLCAFWKQVLDNTIFTIFIFRVWGGGYRTVASPLRTLAVTPLSEAAVLKTCKLKDNLKLRRTCFIPYNHNKSFE